MRYQRLYGFRRLEESGQVAPPGPAGPFEQTRPKAPCYVIAELQVPAHEDLIAFLTLARAAEGAVRLPAIEAGVESCAL